MAETEGRHFKAKPESVPSHENAAPQAGGASHAAHKIEPNSVNAPTRRVPSHAASSQLESVSALHGEKAAQGSRFKKAATPSSSGHKFKRSHANGAQPARSAGGHAQASRAHGVQPVAGTQRLGVVSRANNGANAGAQRPNSASRAQNSGTVSGVNPVAGVTRGNVTNRSEKTRNAQRAGFMGSSNRSPYADTGSKRVPKKPKGKRDIISKVLLGIGLALLLIAGGLFVYARMGYKQASDYYNSIADDVLTDTGGIPEIDFAALKEISDDVVGWIYIPDTPVNYVVAQGESNETYLRHMLNGEYNQNGTVFMDVADTAPGMIDQQTTLYGHHMEDGSMFKFIDQTQDQKVFDTIDELYYITDGKTYVLKPLFTMVVEDTYLDARTPNFESIDEFHQYLNTSLGKARAKAKNASDRIDNVDHVMTLITCAGEIIPRTTRAGMVCEVVDSFEN